MFVEFSLHFPKPVFELIKNPIMIPFLFEEKIRKRHYFQEHTILIVYILDGFGHIYCEGRHYTMQQQISHLIRHKQQNDTRKGLINRKYAILCQKEQYSSTTIQELNLQNMYAFTYRATYLHILVLKVFIDVLKSQKSAIQIVDMSYDHTLDQKIKFLLPPLLLIF